MSNKIKIREDHSEYRLTPRGERLVGAFGKTKELGKEAVRTATKYAVRGVVVGAAGISLAIAADQLDDDAKFKGDQPVQITKVGEEDGTLREATFNHVDGVNGANIDETLDYIIDDSRNENLRDTDGVVVDVGTTVYMPESAEKK